jgi:aspartate/methionine/tyrosine aminotransferase
VRPRPFEIERYFARYEFASRHLLSCSDCEPLTMAEVLALADEETRLMWADLSLAYTDSAGAPALRQEIASLYTGVRDDQVLEVVPEEGILLAMQTILDPGDHVVVTWPAYQSLYSIAEAIGCTLTPWRAREEEGWRFDPADLEEALRPDTRLVVVNFPHNPTGHLPSARGFERIVRIVRDSGARLFCDEMYRMLEQDPADRLASAVELDPTALVLSGMSKTLSLPGIRVGWLASRDEDLMARLAAAKDYTTICGSAPSEVLAIIGLRARTTILARNLRICRDNLDAIDAFAGRVDGFGGWTRPKAGSVGLARWDVAGGTHSACERLATEAGIMLLPSSVFQAGDGHVRLGFGRSAFGCGLEAFALWASEGREDGA